MAEKTVSATVTASGSINLPILYEQGGVKVTEDFDAACVRWSVVTDSSGSQISTNDEVDIEMGFSGDTGTMMTDGLVDTVTASRPPGIYIVEGRDKLKKAVDYFIVEATMDKGDFFNPRFDNGSTAPHEIIDDILEECGLDLAWWDGDAGWEIGTADEGTPFQLVSAWDAIQQVAVIGVWKVWCDTSGSVHFNQVVPEPESSSGTLITGDSGTLLSCRYSKSDDGLRNKVVVIGSPDGIGDYYTATASASSPYLPDDFYKTAVISSDLIGSAAMAQDTADLNLTKFNKLTERVEFEAEGDHSVHVQDTLTISEAFTGVAGDWFIHTVTHTIDRNGYTMTGTGVK